VRILFAAIAEKTIFSAMVPLAWALRTAGHEVRVASQPGFASVITQAGLTAVPVGRDTDTWRVVRAIPELLELARAGLPEPWAFAADATNVTWERMRDGHAGAVHDGHRRENFPIIAGLVEFARRWQPDLVVWEPLTYAGSIAAKACGVAHLRIVWSVDIFGMTRDHYLRLMHQQPPGDRDDPLANWLASYGRKYGYEFTEDMTTGQLTINQLPPSLQLPADIPSVSAQYVPYGGPAVVPQWLSARPERPRVALTLGTTANDRLAGYAVNVAEILDAIADLDVEIIATIAEAEQARLGRLSSRTRVVPYVPLHALAPTCTAVIHHGGFGTLATFARYGVPQLALPYHFEGPLLSRKLAEQGAGLAIHASAASGDAVRKGLLRLLAEPTFPGAAARLQAEIHGLPTLSAIVPRIEQLAAGPAGIE
jgi:glycosyltransferase (activator-dependent family)